MHVIEDDNGSLFGDFTCGVPRVDGIPCHHMVSVCKNKNIVGLNENNIMPNTYYTKLWREWYPRSGVLVRYVANFETLQGQALQATIRLCPAISVPRKAGHPKEIERIKSSQELALEQKVKSRRPQRWTQMVQQRQEELERRGGDGDNEGSEDKKRGSNFNSSIVQGGQSGTRNEKGRRFRILVV